MTVKVTVKGLQITDKLQKKTKRITKDAITEYTWDLHRVSTLRTPVDDGNLEKQGTKDVDIKTSNITGKVSFKAMNGNFNYAKKMHDGVYSLGPKSISKSKKKARSKYSKVSFAVGPNYLYGTAKSCTNGYKKDIKQRIANELD